jgi:hypothetical protein
VQRVRGSFSLLPAHLIRDIAIEYLSPWDRRHLCDSSRALRCALIAIVSAEGAPRHIPLVVTVSGVHRMLAEIARLPDAKQEELLIELATRNDKLPLTHRYAGAEAVLEFVKDWQPEPRARIIAGLATTLRMQGMELCEDGLNDPYLRVERPVWEAALRLPVSVRGIAEGALLKHNAISFLTPIRLPKWVEELHAFPPSGRAALLTGLAKVWRFVTDDMRAINRTEATWEVLIREALDLPAHLRLKPLYAVASIASSEARQVPQRWDRLMELAATRPEEERVVIYRSLAETMSKFPQKSRTAYFDALWRCCDELPWSDQLQTLEAMAAACLEFSVPGYGADRIVEASITQLPPQERLIPLKVLAATAWADVDMQPRMRALILRKTRDLPLDERAQVLGYCGMGMELTGDMQPLLAEARTLPGAVRPWVLAGATHSWPRIERVGGAKWVDSAIMPLLQDIPPANRTDVLLNLAIIAFGGRGGFALTAKELQLTPATWATVERYISELPAAELAKLLPPFIKLAKQPDTLAWEWALKRTNELPAALRSPLLRKLARVPFMPPAGRSAPLHKLLPAISAMPAFYRAYPLQAVDAANGKVDGFGDFIGYWRAVFKIAAAKRALPREDRF